MTAARRSSLWMAPLVMAAVLAPPTVLAQKVTLKLNLGTPAGNPYNVGAEAFKKQVEADTQGAITVQVFPSAQLGGETESAKNVQLGTLEATIVSTSNLGSFYDKFAVFSVPYLFKSVTCSFPVVDGQVGQDMSTALLASAHIRVLGYPTFGARHLVNTKRRVIKPDDLKGLKIRAPDPLLEATWRTLGANPTPLPFPEVFNALQQGVIDGDANPLTSIQTFRWYEAAKYVSFTNTAVGIGVFIINDPFFQKLSKEQQAVILKAAAASIAANRASEAELNKKAEAFLRANGVTFDTPNQDEFRARLTPVFEQAKQRFGADLLDRIGAEQKGC